MDKKRQLQFNLNSFLIAISDISLKEGKQLAYLSLKIGEKYNLEPQDMFDLCAYSFVFNKNLSQEELLKLPFANAEKHFLVNKNSPIEKIVNFSNAVLRNDTKIFDDELNNDIANIFEKISKPLSFWLDLKYDIEILNYIYRTLYDFTVALDFEKVLEITSIFGYKDVSRFVNLCEKMTDFYGFEHKDKMTFLIASSLHDIGKFAIDDNILNKPAKLTDEEYKTVQGHVYYTSQALSKIFGFDDINKWASRHHETLDGNGYPNCLSAKDLSLKDRLMACMDIYSALTENKPYRKAFSHNEAINLMNQMAQNYKIDGAIVDDIDNLFKL